MKILVTGASTDIGLKLTKRLTKNLGDLDELFLLSFTQSVSNEIDLDIHKKIKIINQHLLSSFKYELKEILINDRNFEPKKLKTLKKEELINLLQK